MLPPQKPERSPGFNCPNCNFFIEMSIEFLLYDKTQTCPGCTTVFSMDSDLVNRSTRGYSKITCGHEEHRNR